MVLSLLSKYSGANIAEKWNASASSADGFNEVIGNQ